MPGLPIAPLNPVPAVSLIEAGNALAADVVVIGTHAGDSGVRLAAGAEVVERALGTDLASALVALEATGRAEEIVRIPTFGRIKAGLIVAVGLGRAEQDAPLDHETVRRAVGAVFRSLSKARRVSVAISDGTDPDVLAAIAEGAALGAYRFTAYKSKAEAPVLRRVEVAVTSKSDRASRAVLRRSKVLAEAVNQTRDLVNTPPNVLNPPSFADYARRRGEQAGLTVEVLDERALRRGNYGGILAVGGGSATPPRLVRLSHKPARAKAKVALVGKGITFDTGGLDLKTAMMKEMKSDMAGAAAVVEAIVAAAALDLPVEVTATVPMAENAVSSGSYRPSDVVRMRNGRMVEIDNTDAEGRIILADAIARACEDSPEYLIETATLTGAQMVALGTNTTGAMGSDGLRQLVVAAGARAGESLWPMPLPAHLRSGLDSSVADLQNVAKDRWGGMLVAGIFLSEFVADGVEWVHLDIAGPSFLGSAAGYNHRGGSGVIVRTIVTALEQLAGTG